MPVRQEVPSLQMIGILLLWTTH